MRSGARSRDPQVRRGGGGAARGSAGREAACEGVVPLVPLVPKLELCATCELHERLHKCWHMAPCSICSITHVQYGCVIELHVHAGVSNRSHCNV